MRDMAEHGISARAMRVYRAHPDVFAALGTAIAGTAMTLLGLTGFWADAPWADAIDPLWHLVPILLGSWGPLGMALAGEVADEIKVGGSANPAIVGVVRSRLARGEGLAGRARGSVRVVLGAVTVVDRDGDAARYGICGRPAGS